ncbi:unnamed protein product [Microthlaspi erraticum]|uniref:Uncharacterized protein n=1 Tax=Microthlaspi erraticum TaxID=1685480 RepID=A0A6D2KD70_9BRAS|nr:unnamed protein product [Microthlaspi erraticum]
MDNAETEQQEEFSEWVVIQTSPKSPPTDASTPQNSPTSQPSHRREYPPGNDDEEDDAVIPIVVGEEEGEESSSAVNLSLPWRVIKISKKRLINEDATSLTQIVNQSGSASGRMDGLVAELSGA